MKRTHALRLPILAGLTTFLAAAPAATAQQVELRLKGSVGDVTSYSIEAMQNIQLPDEFGGEQSMQASMTVESRVTEVRGDTLVRVLTVKDPVIEGTQQIDMTGVAGKEFTQEITMTGQTVSFASPEGLGAGGASVASSLEQFGSLRLPTKAVGVGDSWTDTVRAEGAPLGLPAEGEMVTVSTITVTGISEDAGNTIADLSVESAVLFEPAADSAAGMDIEMTSDVVSNVRFDATNGVILGSSSASDFAASISGAGVPGPISIYGNTESTVTRQ